MMQPAIVISNSHYLRVSIEPPTSDVLTIRKSTSDALAQTFGQTSATTYLDILWINDEGSSAVIRVHKDDAMKVSVAMASWSGSPALSVAKESPFLPSLLSTSADF